MSLVRFTDTSSTEIYTYLHTLSLHDALPIFAVLAAHDPQRRAGRHRDWRRHGDRVEAGRRRPDGLGPVRDGAGPHRRDPGRSEEHTSELQSLMRITYAVFCLKKKKIRHSSTKYTQHQSRMPRLHTKSH